MSRSRGTRRWIAFRLSCASATLARFYGSPAGTPTRPTPLGSCASGRLRKAPADQSILDGNPCPDPVLTAALEELYGSFMLFGRVLRPKGAEVAATTGL